MNVDRTKYIGGSDIAAILGISPWRNAVDLWLDKVEPRSGDGSNAATRRGNRLEPYIADMIRDEYGLKIIDRNVRHVDPVVPFFACEVDVEIAAYAGTETDNGEIKTVHPFKARDWGAEDTDELPLHYVAQAQWGLGITGRKVCQVFALIGDDLRRHFVLRDDETIDAMRARALEFWAEYVETKIRPPIDYTRGGLALDTLRRIYPGTDGSTREATAMDEHWRAVLQTATAMRDKYDGVIEGARAHILSEMGSAALLKFADGKAFRRKTMTRKGYTVEPATYTDLRLVNLKDKDE